MQDLPEQGHSIPHTGKRLLGQDSAGHTHSVPPSPAGHYSQRQQLWCSLVVLLIIIVVLLILHILHSSKSVSLPCCKHRARCSLSKTQHREEFCRLSHYGHMKEALCQLSLGQRLKH